MLLYILLPLIIGCILLCGVCLRHKNDKTTVEQDVDVEKGHVPVPQKRTRKKKSAPPSPAYILVVPCNTPNPKKKKKKNREKEYTRKKRKSSKTEESLTFSKTQIQPWTTKVEVLPLEFSEHNYRKNQITASLFAGSIHMGYAQEEKEEVHRDVNSAETSFSSWRELYQMKMSE